VSLEVIHFRGDEPAAGLAADVRQTHAALHPGAYTRPFSAQLEHFVWARGCA